MSLPKPISFEVRWRQQNGRCAYCALRMIDPRKVSRPASGKLPGLWATKDHVLPKSKGGMGGGGNTVLACYACNLRKGGLGVLEFLVREGAWLYRRAYAGGGKLSPANDNRREDGRDRSSGDRPPEEGRAL